MRVLMLAAVASLVPPAGVAGVAGAVVRAGAETSYTGSVAATTAGGPTGMAGRCSYAGRASGDGIRFAFGGEVAAYTAVSASYRVVTTRVVCTLVSPYQPGVPGSPPTLTMRLDVLQPGSVASTQPAVTPPWPARPVRVCVAGDARYGPVHATGVLDEACSQARTGTCDPPVVACLAPGAEITRYAVPSVDAPPGPGHRVAGHVDAYRFLAGPAGVAVTLPCIVLFADGGTVDPCAAAGGTFLRRELTLLDTTVAEPGAATGPGFVTIGVCEATLAVTILGYGADSAPVLTVC